MERLESKRYPNIRIRSCIVCFASLNQKPAALFCSTPVLTFVVNRLFVPFKMRWSASLKTDWMRWSLAIRCYENRLCQKTRSIRTADSIARASTAKRACKPQSWLKRSQRFLQAVSFPLRWLVSRLFLTTIYFLLVTPIGFLRRRFKSASGPASGNVLADASQTCRKNRLLQTILIGCDQCPRPPNHKLAQNFTASQWLRRWKASIRQQAISANNDAERSQFETAAKQKSPNVIFEFIDFLLHNKKWWLTPIILVLLVFSVFIALTSSAIAPFIYVLF